MRDFTSLEAWMVRLPMLEVSVSLEVHVHSLEHTYAPVKQNAVQTVLRSAHVLFQLCSFAGYFT